VIDDLIVYYLSDTAWRIVVNAGTADKDVAWMQARLAEGGFDATLTVRRDLAMIAVQGPNARAKTWAALPGSEAASAGLKPFQAAAWGDFFIARTGYTGEDGFELTLPADQAAATWAPSRRRRQALRPRRPRHPAPRSRHGPLRQRHGREHLPLDAGLAWTVDFSDASRDFVGKAALARQARQPPGARPGARRQGRAARPPEGLHRPGRRRNHQRHLLADPRKGHRHGPPAPRRGAGDSVEVDIRGKRLKARVVKASFVRKGQALI
jgi:aminomethyltransferase